MPSSPLRRPPRVPLAGPALALALGIALDRLASPFTTSAWAVLTLSLALAGIGLLTLGASRTGRIVRLLALLALGGGYHHHRWSDLAPDDLARFAWSPPEPAWLRGLIIDGPDTQPPGPIDERGRTRLVLAVTSRSDGRDWHPASGKVVVYLDGKHDGLALGRPVEVVGTLGALPGPLNPGEHDRRDRWRAEGVRLRLSVETAGSIYPDPSGRTDRLLALLGDLRTSASNRLVAPLDPRAAPLADALLLGRREGVDPDINDAFARTGTSHLLAISGLHLQAVAAVLAFVLVVIGTGRRRSALILGGATLGYAVLVGAMPSVVRSAAMTLAACAAAALDRRGRPSQFLTLAALATLLMNPSYLFDVGCQLSFLAVAALVWGVPPLARGLGLVPEADTDDLDDTRTPAQRLDAMERRYWPRWRTVLHAATSSLLLLALASAVVWAATLPLVMFRFHLVPLVGLLLNMVLVGLALPTLVSAALTLVGLPGAAWLCSRLIDLNVTLVTWGAAVPGGHRFVAGPPAWWVLGFYAALGVTALAAARLARPRVAWTAFALALALSAPIAALTPRPEYPEATVLAVDHGLSVLVRSPDGPTLLYDCGKMRDPHVGRRLIAPALWALGVRRIDVLVLSHADSDHYNALPDLLERIPVGAVRVPPGFGGPANPSAEAMLQAVRSLGVPVLETAAGVRLDLGPDLDAEVLHPPLGWLPDAADNDRSLVLDLARGGRHLLLTGDLDGAGQAELIAGPHRPIDAMLAPHHGGRSANPPWLHDWAKSRVVLASQRRPLDPEADALAPLQRAGTPVLRTWRDGALILRWLPDALQAVGWLDPPRRSPFAALAFAPFVHALAAAFAFVAGLIVCLTLGIIEFGAWSLVTPGRRHDPSRPDREPPPWQPINANAPDGARLAGAWLDASKSGDGRTLALLHGFAEDRSALVGRAEALAARGWNVAVLDSRGRGGSGGDRTSFGGREASDLVAWLDVLSRRAGPTPRLAAWGRSMGAAIALRAAAEDQRLRGLVLEAPYPDLTPTVAAWLRRLRLPGLLARPMLRRAARLAGTSLTRPRPIDLAPCVHIPTLVVHGTDDPIASPGAARRLADAIAGPVTFLEVPGARHSDVFDLGGPDLADQIAAFLDLAVEADANPPDSQTRPDEVPASEDQSGRAANPAV